MITLDATDETLEILASAATSIDWFVSYADQTTTAFTPGNDAGNSSAGGTLTLLTAPAASTQRQLKFASIRNRATTAQAITIKFDKAATERYLTPEVTLQGGETLEYTSGGGWYALTTAGARKLPSAVTGAEVAYDILKVGTATEAAGVWYSHAKDTGAPGAWAPGTPGLAGRATDGTTAADNGCLKIPNAASGANYVTSFSIDTAVTGTTRLMDVLWVNSGLVVTTTTAQTINSVAFPARCADGTANGAGVMVGLLVTTATTNAGAIATITMSYTDQDGIPGNTATIASFPATAVIGTIVWFQLAAGDSGVRSIQTITLGTTLTAGAVSLIAVRTVANVSTTTASVGADAPIDPSAGVRLYNGACLLVAAVQSVTTAATRVGSVGITTR